MDKQKIIAEVTKDIPRFMDKMFGKGNWIFDKSENLYITANPKYKGPDFGFIAVRPDGSFFTGVRPKSIVQ